MGPVERSIPSILDLMRQDNANPKKGRPLAIERVYQANFISEDQYKAILEEQRNERRRANNSQAISEMEAESAELEDRMRRAKVPAKMATVSIDLSNVDALLSGRWLYIHGSDSIATTRRACMALKGWLTKYRFGLAAYERSTSVLSGFRNDEADLMLGLSNTGLLVLTGLGAEAATDWAVGKLYELLERRAVDEKPTIVTSWCSPQELAEHLGGRGNEGVAKAIVRLLRDRALLIEA